MNLCVNAKLICRQLYSLYVCVCMFVKREIENDGRSCCIILHLSRPYAMIRDVAYFKFIPLLPFLFTTQILLSATVADATMMKKKTFINNQTTTHQNPKLNPL